jgi:hypothetical protein
MVPGYFSWATAILLLASTTGAVIVKGQTVAVGSNTYYVPPNIATNLSPRGKWSGQEDGLVPLTVFRSDARNLSTAAVKDMVDIYERTDDVFSAGFLESTFTFPAAIKATIADYSRRLRYIQWQP